MLHSGYESLTPQTIAIDEATSYQLSTRCDPVVLEASMILPLDNGSWLGAMEYRLSDQEISTEGTLLSSNVPQYIPYFCNQIQYLQAEHLLLFNSGIDEVVFFKFYKQADGAYSQMAWGKWKFPVTIRRIEVLDGCKLVFLGDDDTFLQMDTADSEAIPCLDYRSTQTFTASGQSVSNANADTVVDISTGETLVVESDDTVTFEDGVTHVCYTGKAISWSLELSPLVLRDDNGLPRADVEATIENVQLDWVGGTFSVQLSGPELPTRTRLVVPKSYTMERKAPGASLGEVRPTRVLVMAPAKRTTIKLLSAGYHSIQLNNVSYNLDITKDWG